ncbi:hypothetical protein BN1708_020284, partial [Verticillium longisporum]
HEQGPPARVLPGRHRLCRRQLRPHAPRRRDHPNHHRSLLCPWLGRHVHHQH